MGVDVVGGKRRLGNRIELCDALRCRDHIQRSWDGRQLVGRRAPIRRGRQVTIACGAGLAMGC